MTAHGNFGSQELGRDAAMAATLAARNGDAMRRRLTVAVSWPLSAHARNRALNTLVVDAFRAQYVWFTGMRMKVVLLSNFGLKVGKG